MDASFSARHETVRHIQQVAFGITDFVVALLNRAHRHDESKLVSPEVEIFDEYTPRLKDTTYDSPEYKAMLKGMAPALIHHYQANRHHPEHFGVTHGVDSMTLVDVVEMFFDWAAATKRHADGDIHKSIEQNFARFQLDSQLAHIFHNTATAMGL